jgi:hypothetical protein
LTSGIHASEFSIVMKKNNQPEILVHCTVDREHIVKNGINYACTKCNRRLLNPSSVDSISSSPGRNPCGIIFKTGVLAMAGALAITGCKESEEIYAVGTMVDPNAPTGLKIVEELENMDFPTAEAIADTPDFVLSPYTGEKVSVGNIPPGFLVNDPSFPIEDQKYFRLPQNSDE